jgi:hypothetical protein
MAIGWLTVLKMVPWEEVIGNAPKIVEGARKLWGTVARKPPSAESPGASPQPANSPEAQSVAMLQTQLAAAKAEIADLHSQMLGSSELIKALAEQNTQLIKRVEVNRIRVLWLAGAVVVFGVVAVISLALTLAH